MSLRNKQLILGILGMRESYAQDCGIIIVDDQPKEKVLEIHRYHRVEPIPDVSYLRDSVSPENNKKGGSPKEWGQNHRKRRK